MAYLVPDRSNEALPSEQSRSPDNCVKYKVDIWHNILWSNYKGAVFSALYRETLQRQIEARFFQIAETENDRRALCGVDLSYHRYPYGLIAQGAYQDIPMTWLAWTLFMNVVRSDADLVVIAGYHKVEFWVQLIAARFTGKRAAFFCDATYLDRPRNRLTGFAKGLFFRSCDGAFCYGQRSREYLLAYGVADWKIFSRCQAAALPEGYNAPTALARRLSILKTGPQPVILYVGRLAPEKNLFILLDAFATLLGNKSGVRLRLVGDGPDRTALEEAAARLGLSKHLEFTGSLSGERLFSQYANATLLVLPSVSEPWGLVVNEALSCGCPVVVSKHCGCVPELVVEGETGFVFSPHDRQDLERTLCVALSDDFEKTRAAEACIRLMETFTPEKAAQAIADGLENILACPEN